MVNLTGIFRNYEIINCYEKYVNYQLTENKIVKHIIEKNVIESNNIVFSEHNNYLMVRFCIKGNIKNIEEKINNKLEDILKYYFKKYGTEKLSTWALKIRISYVQESEFNEERLNKMYNYTLEQLIGGNEDVLLYATQQKWKQWCMVCNEYEECMCYKNAVKDATYINAGIEGELNNQEKYITLERVKYLNELAICFLECFIEEVSEKNITLAKKEVEELKKYEKVWS